MADHWWLGTTSTDHAAAANWSIIGTGGAAGASVPGTGDDAIFDGNSSANCLVSAPWALGNMDMQAAFTQDIDLATYDLTMDDGGDVILAGAGTFDMGTGTLSILNGTLDYSALNALDEDSSTVTFDGDCDWVPKAGGACNLNAVTIASGSTSVLPSVGAFNMDSNLIINGSLIIGAGSSLQHIGAVMTTGPGASLSGAGTFLSVAIGAGKGFVSRGADTTIDIAQFQMRPTTTSPDLPPGVYDSAVKIYNSAASAGLLTLQAGDYTFSSLELESTNDAGTVTLETGVATSVTVEGALTIDLDNAADITVDDSNDAGACIWHLQGDTVDGVTGGGDFIWTPGSEPIVFDGDSDQDIDFHGYTIPDFTIDKDTGYLTLESGTFVMGANSVSHDYTVSGDADVDHATFNLTCADGADVLLDTSGTFDMGTGTLSIENGTFDYSGITGTLDDGESTVIFTGTCSWIAESGTPLNNILTGDDSVITASAAPSVFVRITGELQNHGDLTLSSGVWLIFGGGSSDAYLHDNSSISGGARVSFSATTSGHGILLYHAGAVMSTDMEASSIHPGAIFVPATYHGKVTFVAAGVNSTLTLQLGDYIFSDRFTMTNSGTNTLTIDSFTNNPNIEFQGDVIRNQASGTITYTKGDGAMLFSGGENQAIDFGGQTTEAITIAKSAGTVTPGDDLVMQAFTGTSGTFDPNGKTITTVADCDFEFGFSFPSAADTFNGCAWVIGGDFSAFGQTMNASAAWTIDVTGVSVISGVGSVEHSDASGSTSEIVAPGWTDGDNNTNWSFALVGDWILIPDTEQEIYAADKYRDNLLIQLQSQAASGAFPVYLAFGAAAVDGEGVVLMEVGDSVIVRGPKARGVISAISGAGASGGGEAGESIEYSHTRFSRS
jgi:hypothetical protein